MNRFWSGDQRFEILSHLEDMLGLAYADYHIYIMNNLQHWVHTYLQYICDRIKTDEVSWWVL